MVFKKKKTVGAEYWYLNKTMQDVTVLQKIL